MNDSLSYATNSVDIGTVSGSVTNGSETLAKHHRVNYAFVFIDEITLILTILN